METLDAVEICAGAGGQALGLEKAGFKHSLVIELDTHACNTIKENRPSWELAQGDVADPSVWDPRGCKGVSLLAGGVPCPPFTIAGKQLGATDERDLFAWAVESVAKVLPRALMLENVRGLSMPRFSGYRQHILDRLAELGYIAEWRLLQASNYGVPQLRPRFVLVALRPEDFPFFSWPAPEEEPPSVGESLQEIMTSRGWQGAEPWVKGASTIAPTIVGGSKKHGGADLGPTRAKRAWAKLGVDAHGVADLPPAKGDQFAVGPKLTCEMVELLQGWSDTYPWKFTGRKTSRYRQIGNAFPPPVAAAVGQAIVRALQHQGIPKERLDTEHDPIYRILRDHNDFMTPAQILRATGFAIDAPELERRMSILSKDFVVEKRDTPTATAYKIGKFRAFTGQEDHDRNRLFLQNLAKIS